MSDFTAALATVPAREPEDTNGSTGNDRSDSATAPSMALNGHAVEQQHRRVIDAVLVSSKPDSACDVLVHVWSPRDVIRLRREYGLPGVLIGSVRRDKAAKASGNASTGPGNVVVPGKLLQGTLPLQLVAHEIVYLLSQGVLRLRVALYPQTDHDSSFTTTTDPRADTFVTTMDELVAVLPPRVLDAHVFAKSAVLARLLAGEEQSDATTTVTTAPAISVTPASKFAGDFLVYQDDPMACHSAAIVHVLPPVSRNAPSPLVDLRDWVTAARLGTNAKKTVVYATPTTTARPDTTSSDARNVQFHTVTWTGW
ncbi:hypothetical protein AMAG_04873 [Allomyces macrogynus ATCC 38327]|uniref:tRNA-intron lyase n=1 Tax=Allomyces macrogynus (strain ATCC 38327) TaxID=578462 RepID=A0A0L0S6B8_ALLM3|nr:hypothetical protein AMAG_04873 [Allomyces macrogynus ATCC 38327]|eukprot:KNE58047.1 hypothetical protein AMAG_04873 [Allomyces macrogynus ATCC 38327]